MTWVPTGSIRYVRSSPAACGEGRRTGLRVQAQIWKGMATVFVYNNSPFKRVTSYRKALASDDPVDGLLAEAREHAERRALEDEQRTEIDKLAGSGGRPLARREGRQPRHLGQLPLTAASADERPHPV